jgi:transposase
MFPGWLSSTGRIVVGRERSVLFVGDDWAEDHHDVEVMDSRGRRLAKARLPEGVAGVARLHAMIAEHLEPAAEEADTAETGVMGSGVAEPPEVLVGIETERGPWVQALIAAGYRVFAINPLQVARYRERHSLSGAKSDAADAHTLADMVRTDSHQLRPVAGDTAEAEAIKVVSRAHKTLIWERTRHTQRLRDALLAYFPAALEAFEDLDAPDALELLAKAPDPASAARLTLPQIEAALKRARRQKRASKAKQVQAALRSEQLRQPDPVTAAYAATITSTAAVLAAVVEQVARLEAQVEAHFGQHPDAEIVRSQPGLSSIQGARVLAEFGDDPDRYATAKARKNYAGTSPITRASGKKRTVAARYVYNDRLVDALMGQAFSALTASPGARAYYDKQRARGVEHNAALRQLANKLVGVLHGCLTHRAPYDETTAWPDHYQGAAA